MIRRMRGMSKKRTTKRMKRIIRLNTMRMIIGIRMIIRKMKRMMKTTRRMKRMRRM